MYKNKRFLAIIPARGGSKRLPKKNILELAGKPLIAWTIEAALKSKYLDRIIVSTDNNDIADISKKYGADVPFIRPSNIATDNSSSIDVAIHAINYLKDIEDLYDYIILLQPTSPLRTEKHIDDAIEYLDIKQAKSVISVCKTDHPPMWCNILPDDNSMMSFLDNVNLNKRSQDLATFYRLNGAIYICKIDSLLEEKNFFTCNDIYAYIMDRKSSIDIDNKLDFEFSKFLFSKNRG